MANLCLLFSPYKRFNNINCYAKINEIEQDVLLITVYY